MEKIAGLVTDDLIQLKMAMAFLAENCQDRIIDQEIVARAPEFAEKNGLSREEVEFLTICVYINLMLSQIENDQLAESHTKTVSRFMRIFSKKEFENNPYLKNVKIKNAKRGNFELAMESYQPYELFNYDIGVFNEYVAVPQIGTFTEKFEYPIIYENGMAWMTITPNEICTMYDAVQHAHGKVLVLGLGLGYFAYMAAIRPEVEEVTVVEISQDVIDLFEENIFPQFKCRDKIEIIQADAIEYLNKMPKRSYDYCFADIWKSSHDIEPYIKVKEALRNHRDMETDCWVERAIAYQIAWCAKIEMFSKATGIPMMMPPECKKLSRYTSRLYRNVYVKTPEDVLKIVRPETAIGLIETSKTMY